MKNRKSISAYDAAIAAPFTTKFEGLSLTAYLCPAGHWTIGHGLTRINGRAVKSSDIITKEQAEKLLIAELNSVKKQASNLVKVEVSRGEFIALIDFAFNAGVGSFKRSTLLKKLNKGRYVDAGYEFRKWVYGGGRELPGLVRRREAEKTLFLNE